MASLEMRQSSALCQQRQVVGLQDKGSRFLCTLYMLDLSGVNRLTLKQLLQFVVDLRIDMPLQHRNAAILRVAQSKCGELAYTVIDLNRHEKASVARPFDVTPVCSCRLVVNARSAPPERSLCIDSPENDLRSEA